MSKKNTIRLTESELKRMISESVKKVLRESNGNTFKYDYSDYRDIYTTCGIKGETEFVRIYERLERLLQIKMPDWEFLSFEEPFYLIKNVKHGVEYMLFKTKSQGNATQEVINIIEQLVDDVKNVKSPNLWMGQAFGTVATEIREYLKEIYEIYTNFIYELMDLHSNEDIKRQDMEADWDKYNKETRKREDNEIDTIISRRNSENFGFSRNVARPLKRYDIVANPDDEQNQKYHKILTGDFDI